VVLPIASPCLGASSRGSGRGALQL
jgi:hypothetical protein